jgi:hypothetical protein
LPQIQLMARWASPIMTQLYASLTKQRLDSAFTQLGGMLSLDVVSEVKRFWKAYTTRPGWGSSGGGSSARFSCPRHALNGCLGRELLCVTILRVRNGLSSRCALKEREASVTSYHTALSLLRELEEGTCSTARAVFERAGVTRRGICLPPSFGGWNFVYHVSALMCANHYWGWDCGFATAGF